MSAPEYDVVIIGGGAAGLSAAVTAAQLGATVAVLERNDRVAKKLMTTGNGRCNISNSGQLEGRYHGDGQFALKVISQVDREETQRFFSDIGIPFCSDRDCRLYPLSLRAASVADALRFAAQDRGADIITGLKAEEITRDGKVFHVRAGQLVISCGAVIVAAGGKAAPATGSDGDGYKLLKSLGHTKTPVFPAIVQLMTEKELIRPLKGIKCDVRLTAQIAGESKSEYGELLFTEYGISGPPVLQFGRFAGQLDRSMITIDMLPQKSAEWLADELGLRRHTLAKQPLVRALSGILHNRVAQTVTAASAKDSSHRSIVSLTDQEIKAIVKNVKEFCLKVTGTLSWDSCQVTAGGIKTAEFSPETMQSRLVSGLFAAGEVLNVDGDCGGFNLQWAWSSGILAGKSAAAFTAARRTAGKKA